MSDVGKAEQAGEPEARRPASSSVFHGLLLALIVSALYPTLFAIEQNWYSLRPIKIAWLVLIVGVVVPAVLFLIVKFAGRLLSRLGPKAAASWQTLGEPLTIAFLCTLTLFMLFWGTLAAFKWNWAILLALFLLVCTVLSLLFVRGAQRYYTALLLVLCAFAVTSLLASVLSPSASANLPALTENRGIEQVKLAERPNIYVFIFDGYGSKETYLKVHGFDNGEHYRRLEEQGFKVLHTFSNYRATWPTALGFFLAKHHFHELESGIHDTKYGRSIMAGRRPNPVLTTLKNNDYRVQYISGANYLATDQGIIDFQYPRDFIHSAVAVYGNPLIETALGLDKYARNQMREQREVLLSRMPPPKSDGQPWFTFGHISRPSHAPNGLSWNELGDFSKDYIERTKSANEMMNEYAAAIMARDPQAIIAFFGDHASQRWRRAWMGDADPNVAMESAGVDPQIVTMDFFGIMIAVYSGGRCDSYFYPSLTPVNLMRGIFACLSHDPGLMAHKAEDISLMPVSRGLWLTARDGEIEPRWKAFEKPASSFSAKAP